LSRLGDLDPGVLLASTPLGQVIPDPYALSFFHPFLGSLHNRRYYADAHIHTLKVSLLPLPSSCYVETGSKGLLLTLDGMILYQDKELPDSRKCAEDYSISELRWYPETNMHVALVSVFKTGFEGYAGFEGYDRTFLAIPFTLSPE
jgi:hypothetical protein